MATIVDEHKLQANWYNRQINPKQSIPKAHLNSIETLSINYADVNQFATGSHDHLIKLWDLNAFKQTSTLKGHKEGIWSTHFSKDGRQLLSASPDKSVIIWDIAKGKEASVLREHQNKVYFCQYNEDNRYIASGGEDQRLIIWDARKGTPLKIIKSENQIIYNIKWSRDGNYLVTSEYGGVCKIFDAKNFELIASFGRSHPDERAWCCDLDFRETSKNKMQIFVGFETRVVKVLTFSPEEKSLKGNYEFLAHMDPVKSVSLDGEKQMIVTSARDGTARVWESFRQTNEYSPKAIGTLLGHSENVSSIQFVPHPSKTILLTSSYDQSVSLYEI